MIDLGTLVLVFCRQQEPASSEQAATESQAAAAEQAEQTLTPEAVDALLPWRSGEIVLGDGLATLHLPPEYRFLDPAPSKRVLEELWGNPPADAPLGMIFPVDRHVIGDDGWGVVLEFEQGGHVSDDDANEIDYDDLLAKMKSGTHDENEEREKAGFGTLELLGWATHPNYDAAKHKLLWAKEIQFSGNDVHTLNYDVRALGRKGVLSMNAVAAMGQLPEVERGMTALLATLEFNAGHRYEDFDSKSDDVAAYGIGGLIAGGLALKAGLFKGLFALIIAAKKSIIVGLAALGAFFAKIFKRKKAAQQPPN